MPRILRKPSIVVLALAAALLVLACGGCQSLVFLLAGESGITGTVSGGGCGVEAPPTLPPQDCGYYPLQTTFSVYDEDSENVVARVTSEADGTFRVPLLPGTYHIRQASVGTVVVTPGEYTEVVVLIEAG
jgi:hypothetical protein